MEKVILKECPHHGLTEYVYRNFEKGYRCRKCSADNVRRRRYRLKEKAVEYKGGKCEICGYDKCIDALEFHHKNPEEKDFGISSGETKSWEKIKKELDKCIMLCANCHREIHSHENDELKSRIMNRYKMIDENRNKKYNENIDKIVDMKDNQNKSFYAIAKELNMNRNTVANYYKRYKNNL